MRSKEHWPAGGPIREDGAATPSGVVSNNTCRPLILINRTVRLNGMATKMIQGHMTVKEAAAEIGITEGRVRQLILDGRIRASRLGARLLLIPVTEVRRVKKEPRRPGPPRVSDE